MPKLVTQINSAIPNDFDLHHVVNPIHIYLNHIPQPR
jgi:hypothetical protein